MVFQKTIDVKCFVLTTLPPLSIMVSWSLCGVSSSKSL